MDTLTTSRAQFLTRGMAGGVVLVAGGSLLAYTASSARAQASGDVEIAKLAATAELLGIDFYAKAIKSGKFKADQLAYLQAAMENEQAHYDFLAGAIGSGAPKGVKFKYPAGTFATAKSIAGTGVALEGAFVGAYLGAVEALESVDLKAAAAQVGANEAQHLTTFTRLEAGMLVPNPAFPESITAKQALAAVTPFLA